MENLPDYKPQNTQEENLIKMYNNALVATKNSQLWQEKIKAFNQVINFCAKDFQCLNDNSRTRDMILYWTYNNLGDIFLEQAVFYDNKSAYKDAAENYQRALNVSRSKDEKINALKRLSDLYEQNGDENSFYTVQDSLIEAYPTYDKREAYERLADLSADEDKQIYFLEKALDFVRDEQTSAAEHCRNTIRLCDKLRHLYAQKKDFANLARIDELRTNTSLLIH